MCIKILYFFTIEISIYSRPKSITADTFVKCQTYTHYTLMFYLLCLLDFTSVDDLLTPFSLVSCDNVMRLCTFFYIFPCKVWWLGLCG